MPRLPLANPPRLHQRARTLPRLLALLSAPLLPVAQTASAAPTELPQVEVVGQGQLGSGLLATDGGGDTVYRVGSEGVALFGGTGGSNPYTVVDRLPGVHAQTADAYGLANIPGGSKGLRVRGELGSHGGTGTINGLPLTGINPGPGYQWLFDLENIGAVSLRQGPVAPDRFGFFTTSGALDSELRGPAASRGLHVSQSIGSHDFRRTYARGDTGTLADGSALFLSASHTSADKWRGPGQSPAGRENFAAGWSRPLGENAYGKLFLAWNDAKADNYRPLTYAQAKDLNNWRNFDYSPDSSATAATAVNYYGYNRQEFTNWTLFGEFGYALDEHTRLTIKPYYLKEKGQYFDGMANGKVRNWLIDHDWYGLTAELATRWGGTDLKFGYWGESSDPPGPPTAWKMYNPTASGGLSGASWSILADTTDRRAFHSLYALAERQFGALRAKAGGRYVRETLPGMQFYNPAGIGDVSLDQALAQSGGAVANRSVGSFTVDEFLPFLALDYRLTPQLDLTASLGRNYGAAAIDVWPVFQQNSATFLAKGITADKLWRELKPETANALDLGLHWRFERGYLAPTLYYARHHHKNVAYDPGIGVAYSQNVGESRATGAQLAAGWSPSHRLDLFASTSYSRNTFVDNLPLLSGATLAVAGQQLPDTPRWQANLGGTWKTPLATGQLSISPLLRYTGERFGDTSGTQKIDGYTTVDLSVGYQQKLADGRLSASLSVQNLFDRKYIGFINASYYQLLSNANAFYYPGAPRTVVAKVGYDF